MTQRINILIFIILNLLSSASFATEFKKGDWLVRGKFVAVHPDEEAEVTPIGGDVNISTAFIPSVDLTYFFDDDLALEFTPGLIPHKAKTKNTLIGDQDAGIVWAVAPTVMLQYHRQVTDRIKPYLGAGMAYIKYFESGSDLEIDYRDDVAVIIQAGVDVAIDDNWSANIDIKQAWADTTAEVNGGEATAQVSFDPVVIGVGLGYKF